MTLSKSPAFTENPLSGLSIKSPLFRAGENRALDTKSNLQALQHKIIDSPEITSLARFAGKLKNRRFSPAFQLKSDALHEPT